VDWINLAQDRDRWLAVVNTGMKLRVPQNSGKFVAEGLFTRSYYGAAT
jgi:hypothetical protein